MRTLLQPLLVAGRCILILQPTTMPPRMVTKLKQKVQ